MGWRNRRDREVEWFMHHGKTHEGRKVDGEDWADVGGVRRWMGELRKRVLGKMTGMGGAIWKVM